MKTMEGLTVIEQSNLAELEQTIQKHLSAFYEVGFALMQIRDNRYYRETHGTFEEYCKERWGFTRMRASQLISASIAMENVNHGLQTPITERALRPLTSLPPDQQREVYQQAVETAPEGKVTAKHIEEVIERVKGQDKATHIMEDSDSLFQLKRWWNKAVKKDKQKFILWIKEANNE